MSEKYADGTIIALILVNAPCGRWGLIRIKACSGGALMLVLLPERDHMNLAAEAHQQGLPTTGSFPVELADSLARRLALLQSPGFRDQSWIPPLQEARLNAVACQAATALGSGDAAAMARALREADLLALEICDD